MLIAHALTIVLAIAIIFGLWRQEAERGRFVLALYVVAAIMLGQMVWAVTGSPVLWVQMVLHGVAWLVLGWGSGLPYAGLVVVIFAFVLGMVFPADLWAGLSWGLAAVLPPMTWIQARNQPTAVVTEPYPYPNTPLFAPPTHTGSAVFSDQRQLLHYVDEGVVVSDANGLVEFANNPAAQMLSTPVDEIIGQPVMDLLARLPMLSGSSLSESKPRVQFEMNGRLLEGRMDVMYDANGRFLGSIAVLRDITDAFQSQRAKDAFLTTISHELRTPLTAIKGYAEMFSSGVVGVLNDDQRQFMEIIQRNVTRMVQLVNSMIFVSAVRGGRIQPKLVYADLRQLVQQIVRELGPAASRSQQTFQVEIDPKLKPIQADSIHVSTMLQELINNSLKYNQSGGIIRIQVSLEMGEQGEQEFVVVRVSDNGIGIPPEEQLHIFDDFYRVDKNDTNLQMGGMGVGLAIVRALVEAYNGRIWLDSTIGRGSTFTFILPARQVDHSFAAVP